MAQKTNPLALRKNVKNSINHQQAYHKKFLAYKISEQEKITYFTYAFFKTMLINLHSFSCIKDQKGNCFLLIKYLYLKPNKKANLKLKGLTFSSFEKAYLTGLNQLKKKVPLAVLFFQVGKNTKNKLNLPGFIKNSKFFTAQEIENTLKVIILSKGAAFFLNELICEKIESFHSKSEKKLQGRLILFLEKLVMFIKKLNPKAIKGLKLQIKGRINGIARTKNVLIKIGILNLQQICKKIDFAYKQSNTVFGSFGIKIWINYC